MRTTHTLFRWAVAGAATAGLFMGFLFVYLRHPLPTPQPAATAIAINVIKVNDTVYIPSILLTGVVNHVSPDKTGATIITDRGTRVDYINTAILKKVPTFENK